MCAGTSLTRWSSTVDTFPHLTKVVIHVTLVPNITARAKPSCSSQTRDPAMTRRRQAVEEPTAATISCDSCHTTRSQRTPGQEVADIPADKCSLLRSLHWQTGLPPADIRHVCLSQDVGIDRELPRPKYRFYCTINLMFELVLNPLGVTTRSVERRYG